MGIGYKTSRTVTDYSITQYNMLYCNMFTITCGRQLFSQSRWTSKVPNLLCNQGPS